MGNDLEKEALSNPSRRRIIEVLGGGGKVSFSQIKKETNISTGAIYYHLTKLQDFIEVDEKRRYRLNKNGERLYGKIVTGYSMQREEASSNLLTSLMMVPLVKNVTRSKTTASMTIIIVLIIETTLSHFTQKGLIFFAPLELYFMDPPLTPLLLSIIPLWLITKLFTLVYVKERFGEIELFAGITLSILPSSIITSITLYNQTLYQIGAIFGMTVSTLLLASVINQTKGITLHTALIYSMIIGYTSFIMEFIKI
ncbi:MAG: helix-turn-helix domain-containing protein [Nitrososphaeria archaeon]